MKRNLKFFALLIFLAALIGIILLLIPLKRKGDIPLLKKDIDYNLLVITIDTLRADFLGCYGSERAETPNIDQLAAEGVMFKNCYASAPLTLPSHCSIFTGREPIVHGVRNNGTYVLNKDEYTLAECFQEKGYETFAAIATFVLEAKFGLNQGFNTYDDFLSYQTVIKDATSEIPADQVFAKFTNWLEKNYKDKFFSWVHFYDPHYPYKPPDTYMEKFRNQPYSGEIAYVDYYIGKIIENLKAKQLLNRTVIILTGDHGEAFGEHNEFGHIIFCYEENLRVPLIFYNPDVFPKDKIIGRPVRLIDIMPTVLHLFGMNVPDIIQGENLLSLMNKKRVNHSSPSPLIYFESMHGKENMNWAPLTGVIFKNYKYISLPNPELYDLEKDPKERKNLLFEKNVQAKKLDKKLREYLLTHANSKKSNRRQLDITDKKRLETLGYISSYSSGSDKIIDPKEGIVVFNKIIKANSLIENNNLEEAENRFNQIIKEHPDIKIAQLYDTLHVLYKTKNDFVKVEKILKKAIEDFPNLEEYKVSLVELYLEMGKKHEAEKLCRSMLDQGSINTQAHLILGRLYYKKGSFTQALSFYKKALELEPLNTHIQIEYAETLLSLGKKEDVQKIISELVKNESFIRDRDAQEIKERIGVMLLKMKEYEQVITLSQKILSHSPGEKIPQVYNQLGKAYFNKGDFEKALKAYENALQLDEKNAITLSCMGTLYLTLFRAKKETQFHSLSVDFYSRALDSNPELVTALNGLAVAYSFVGNRSKAISYWERANRIAPNFINIYFNLGITYLEMGEKKKALKYLGQIKDKFYSRLNTREQQQLNNLITEANQ